MEAVWILAIIFTFVIVISTIENKHELKKKKIEAALRMQEMAQGIKPGTYSRMGSRTRKRKKKTEEDASSEYQDRQYDRAQLKKGIEELQERLDNLQTIMESRKAHQAGTDTE
jgi:Asp-tRNA(Asn)/Glu-tRNA(Gln) amidotransferase A subunit family amidase